MNEIQIDMNQVVSKLTFDIAGLVQQVAILEVMNKQLEEENNNLKLSIEAKEQESKPKK